jgi:DNA-directed RNA polymerase subunit RPC12/RpoP
MSANVLIDCPKCGRKIRIPSDSGTIHVTCPACGEQWDWPKRRVPSKGATRQAAKDLSAALSGRLRGWWRAALSPGRFSWAQLFVAGIAGIGIGILLGGRLHIHNSPIDVGPPETASLPAAPLIITNTGPVATNILNPPGINQKTEEVIPSGVQDLQPAKSR